MQSRSCNRPPFIQEDRNRSQQAGQGGENPQVEGLLHDTPFGIAEPEGIEIEMLQSGGEMGQRKPQRQGSQRDHAAR